MSVGSTGQPRAAPFGRRAVILAGVAVVVAGVAAYWNSFSGVFVYDDILTIVDNPAIRRLWPITEALIPPKDSGLPVAGRPLVNLSLALNYAWRYVIPRFSDFS